MLSPQRRAPPPVVCHLIETLVQGGAEAIIHRLAVGSPAAGYQTVVCALRTGQVEAKLRRDGIPVEVLDVDRPSIRDLPAFMRSIWRTGVGLRAVVKRHGVTMIHAHLPDSILRAAAFGAVTGVPVIGTYHGLGIQPHRSLRLDPRPTLRALGYRWAERRCRRTIVVAASIRDLLCREYGFRPATTLLIPNAIDTASFGAVTDDGRLRAALGLTNRRIVICVGRLISGKGQRFLVQAMSLVRARHPDAHLLLVGEGRDHDGLRSLAAECGLADRVTLLGNRSDVVDLLVAADVFVLPSFSEGLPVSVMEAMAAGKPMVVTDIPGNLEAVGDERCGLIVPPGDAASLAAAVIRLLDDPALSAELGRQAQARARAQFDVDQMIARTTAVYDAVLAESRIVGRFQPHSA